VRTATLALALATLALVAVPVHAQNEDRTEWWDEDWHFRLPLTITPEGATPVTGSPVALTGEPDPVVLAPVDVTQALAATHADEGPDWPLDSAGRPADFTLDPDSIRVFAVDGDGRIIGDPDEARVPARLLPYTVNDDGTQTPFDPGTNARGTLALALEGSFEEARSLHVYFDTVENGPFPAPEEDPARPDRLATTGPGVYSYVHVPGLDVSGHQNLVAVGDPDTPEASITAERIPTGAEPETVVDDTVDTQTRFDLPTTREGYTLRVESDRPVQLAVETATEEPQGSRALFFPSTDGGPRGERFLLPGLAGARASPTVQVIGTEGRTDVTVRDAVDGGAVTEFSVSSQQARGLDIPREALYELSASAPVLVLADGEAADGRDRFLHTSLALDGEATGSLALGSRALGHLALAPDPTTVRGFPLATPEDTIQGRVGDPPRYTWNSAEAGTAQGQPWAFFFDGADGTVLLGDQGHTLVRPDDGFRLALPDTDEGRPFTGHLTLPLGSTTVDYRARHLNGSTILSQAGTVAQPSSLGTVPGESTPIVDGGRIAEIETDRPAILQIGRQGSPASTFLPTLPPTVGTEPGTLDFFGSLLSWRTSFTKQEVQPGERATVDLAIANNGVARDGTPLTETLNLTLSPLTQGTSCQANWTASLTRSQITDVASPGQATASALVPVPDDADEGACAAYRLEAASTTNDETATARIQVRVASGFQPSLTVIGPDGEAADTGLLRLSGDEPGQRELVLANAGTGAGDVRLRFPPGPGHETQLLAEDGTVLAGADGDSREPITVTSNSSRRITLETRAQASSQPPWDFFVQATSAEDPNVRDTATVTAVPGTNESLAVTPETRRLQVPTGGNGTVDLDLRSLGDPVEVRVTNASDLPPGWQLDATPQRVLVGAEADASDPETVQLRLRLPADAELGDAQPFQIAVQPTIAPEAGQRVSLTGQVVNNLTLDAQAPATVSAAPAVGANASLSLHATAAGPVNLTHAKTLAPAGWTVDLADLPKTLSPGARATARIDVQPPAGAEPTTERVQVVIERSDPITPPATTTLGLDVTVPEGPALTLENTPANLTLAPGERVDVPLHLVNRGNRPGSAEVTLDARGGLDATIDTPDRLDVLASAATTLTVRAPEEPFVTAHLTLTGPSGRTLGTLPVDEEPVDLALADARQRPGTDAIEITVDNQGPRRVDGVLVRVDAGDETIRQRLAGIDAGTSRSYEVPLTADVTGADVEVQAVSSAVDATPQDNRQQLTAESRDTPIGWLGLGLALLAARRWPR